MVWIAIHGLQSKAFTRDGKISTGRPSAQPFNALVEGHPINACLNLETRTLLNALKVNLAGTCLNNFPGARTVMHPSSMLAKDVMNKNFRAHLLLQNYYYYAMGGRNSGAGAIMIFKNH